MILAGPNGAGKSTAASVFIPADIPFLNADEIAKALPGYPSRQVDLLAGRELIARMGEFEGRHESFAVETTLASRTLAQRIVRLRRSGYLAEWIFLWTPDPEFSIRRVAERVRLGGHSVPEETIRRRHRAGIKNLIHLYIPIVDVWKVYNNTAVAGFRLVAAGTTGAVTIIDDPVIWDDMNKGAADEPEGQQAGPA